MAKVVPIAAQAMAAIPCWMRDFKVTSGRL
jgi:hypothetical protein